MKQMLLIYGYGNGEEPLYQGICMGYAMDLGYAKSFVEAMALLYRGQWFGYSEESSDGPKFSVPVRFSLQSAE